MVAPHTEISRNGHAPSAVATRTVAICGTAGSSRREIMQQPEGVELWGLNLSYTWMPRWDRWFEMHDRDLYGWVFKDAHLAWLRAAEIPIYMQRAHDDIPRSVAFPVEAVTEGGRFEPYFTSSVAYMIALAIHEGFEEIRLLGANMATDSEYAYQRAACEYWIGVAQARGIKVYLPPSCPLTVGPRYGADRPNADLMRAVVDKRESVKVQIEQTHAQLFVKLRGLLDDHLGRRHEHAGALNALGQFGGDAEAIARVRTAQGEQDEAFFAAALEELLQHETTITACQGALQLADQLLAGNGTVHDLHAATQGEEARP